jgi:nitrile hydratase
MTAQPLPDIVTFTGEDPLFQAGDHVRISVRYPVGHYRVPRYVRGKIAMVEAVIRPRAVSNEEEGFGLNAGLKRYYYRVSIPLSDLWPGYLGSPYDNLRIEVFESWLERAD